MLPRNRYARENGNGSSTHTQGDRSRVRKPASRNQVKAILAIARKQNIELGTWLQQEYETERCEELTIGQASELINLNTPAGP